MAAEGEGADAFLRAGVMAAADDDDASEMPETPSKVWNLNFQFMGKTIAVCLTGDHTILALKTLIASHTKVSPSGQKLIGLKLADRADGRKVLEDLDYLGDCALKDGMRIMVVGTPSDQMFVDPADMDPSLLPDVLNDLGDFAPSDATVVRDPEVEASLRAVIETREFRLMHQPRPGVGLLVLDLDYTLLDTKNRDRSFAHAMRPFLHEFLSAVYVSYDIVIWSQTKWTWLEMKLSDMGMLSNPQYAIMATLDETHMFHVTSMVGSEPRRHLVKPLEVLWAKLPQFSAANTVHVDDLSRNFALNVGSGIKCRAYKESMHTHLTDKELPKLALYLKHVAGQDLRTVDHAGWRKVVRALGKALGSQTYFG